MWRGRTTFTPFETHPEGLWNIARLTSYALLIIFSIFWNFRHSSHHLISSPYYIAICGYIWSYMYVYYICHICYLWSWIWILYVICYICNIHMGIVIYRYCIRNNICVRINVALNSQLLIKFFICFRIFSMLNFYIKWFDAVDI